MDYKKGNKKDSKFGLSVPYHSVYTSRGMYIICVVLICSLLGFVLQMSISAVLKQRALSLKGEALNEPEKRMVEERATLISAGIVIVLLIILLLNTERILKIMGRKRMSIEKD